MSDLDRLLNDDPVAQTVIPPEPAGPAPLDFNFADPTEEQLVEALYELARRRSESLRIYEALPNQVAFHESRAGERILRGSVRAGKTLPAAVEVARAVTGRDPFSKYPARDGRCYIVGPNEDHLADVIWKKLCRSGPFKMLRDSKSGAWRPFRPWIPEDVAREKEAKPAPPLIPNRYISEIAWEDKKRGVPRLLRLTSGWEVTFFTANMAPQRGVDVDLVWFDEEIASETWYSEMSARLLDREGRFIWSAAPQTGTQDLYEIHKRCQAQQHLPREKRTAEEFEMLLSVNPYIKETQKKLLAQKLDADQHRVLIEGQYAYLSYLIYPEFMVSRHGINSFPLPANWSYYMLVDTGRQVAGSLFFVVPPDEFKETVEIGGKKVRLGGKKICFDEVYLKSASASSWGDIVAPKIRTRNFISFIIDHQGARQSDIGSGKTVEDQYSDALLANGVTSRYGRGFLWGSTDVKGRLSKFRSWLEPNKDGEPTFLFFKDVCSWIVWEFERYHNKKVKGQLVDEPEKRHDHLMDLCGYAAMHGLPWVAPPQNDPHSSTGDSFLDKLFRKGSGNQHNYISLG